MISLPYHRWKDFTGKVVDYRKRARNSKFCRKSEHKSKRDQS